MHDDVTRALLSGKCSQFPRSLRKMEAKQQCKDDCNQSNDKLSRIVLTENDVPGASLNGKETRRAKKRGVEALVEVQRGECIRHLYATSTKVIINLNFCTAFLFLLLSYFHLCQYPILRVKDYIGLQRKIIDPDGGTHFSKRLKQLEECDTIRHNKIVEWPSEGWTLSLGKAPEFQHCFIFFVPIWREKQRREKTRGVQK